jgi:two-component system response regulator HydG
MELGHTVHRISQRSEYVTLSLGVLPAVALNTIRRAPNHIVETARKERFFMAGESILLVGNGSATEDLATHLSSGAWQIDRALELDEALERLGDRESDVVIVDADSVGVAPWHALDGLNGTNNPVVLVVPPETSMAVFDGRRFRPRGLLTKPIDKAALHMTVESALVYKKLLRENKALKRQLGSALSLGEWVGCTPESQEVRNAIATAALASGPVLLLGEDGSGRRLAAELIHRNGRNPGTAFVPLEIPSIPEGELDNLLEELTSSDTLGRYPVYNHGPCLPGTLFLSEINGLSEKDQKALVDFAGQPMSFRLMASAHPSIREAVRLGRFNRRLFDIMSPLSIHVPPLRDRRGDIPVLIDHFLRRACERLSLQPLGIPSDAIDRYTSYDWPGNVGELSMVIERAISIASAAKFEGTTLPDHFCAPPSLTYPEPTRLKTVSLRELIADIEKRIIIQTLESVNGSQKKAAERLRLNPTTLHEKMKRYKILPGRARNRTTISVQ